MDLYDKMLNIREMDTIKELEKLIASVRDEFNDLTTDRTCKIYNGYLSRKLRENGIPNRLVNTNELGISYEHEFVLFPDDVSYSLADLTYEQFKSGNPLFAELLINGYQRVDDETMSEYLDIVSKKKYDKSYSVDDIYHNYVNKSR